MAYKDKEKQREYQREWEKKNRSKGTRHKVWMFVFYPDSADEDWREIADELGLPFCVSPLHDRDTWTKKDERKNPKHKAGTVKKPHWHGLADYPQPVDYETVKSDFEFLGTSNIKYAKSKASMALYLCHLGSKDKAQYDPDEVLEFGGANWHDWCSELQDLHAMMKEMRAWLRENSDIHRWEFQFFVDWCDSHNDEWSRALDLQCSWAIGNYMEHARKREQCERVERWREIERVRRLDNEATADADE